MGNKLSDMDAAVVIDDSMLELVTSIIELEMVDEASIVEVMKSEVELGTKLDEDGSGSTISILKGRLLSDISPSKVHASAVKVWTPKASSVLVVIANLPLLSVCPDPAIRLPSNMIMFAFAIAEPSMAGVLELAIRIPSSLLPELGSTPSRIGASGKIVIVNG